MFVNSLGLEPKNQAIYEDEKKPMQSIQLLLPNAEATYYLGQCLGKYLLPGSIILLQGDIGSGKTSLVQGIGLSIGISDPLLSPTFTLINEYLEGRIPLYHFDLYRLESPAIDELNLDMYWEGREVPPGIVAIEWAERLPVLPSHYLQIRLQIVNPSSSTPLEQPSRLAVLSVFGQVSPLLLEQVLQCYLVY
jgi:tRNA threonylcarbamoyladenosine biosynthesis protein TsaE